MYLDAEYGQSAPMNLVHAILLYGSEKMVRLATVHNPINDPQGGPPLLDAGEPLTRDFLDDLVKGLGSELPAEILPCNVLVYSTSLTAWWEPAQVRSMFFAPDCDGKTLDGKLFPHPPLVFGVRSGRLMVWALAEDRRPDADSWLYMAPYWNTYDDGSVCHGSMPTPKTATIDNLPQWSHAFFASRFTGSNLGIQQCSHPEGFLGLWRSLIGKKKFPVEHLLRKRRLREALCRSR
jgi:PRTRC genetic system protein B